MNTIKRFVSSKFEKNIYPWQVKMQMENLSDKNFVSREGVYYADKSKYRYY